MTSTATIKTNSRNDLNIIFECSGQVYTTSLISEFTYENELNIRPYGSFILKDNGEFKEIGLRSGSFGFLYFTNTSDGVEEKTMTLPIYLENVDNFDKVNQFSKYKIKWSAGTLNQINVNRGDVIKQANSTDALRKIFDNRNSNVIPFSGLSKPTDNMNWIIVNQDMWKQLDSVVNKSFLANDYIFWVWDDVNNKFKISSISTEYNKKDTYLFKQDPNIINSTIDSTYIIGNNELTIFSYNTHKKFNVLGSHHKKLFPNISFLGIPSNDIKSGSISNQNFITLLKSLRDTKLYDILKETGLESQNAIFGELQLRKQHLNGHNLYAFSDIYRNYKISTYAKMFMVQIYNTIGPPIGNYVSVANVNSNSSAVGILDIDKRFSDRYIIVKKIIQYSGQTITAHGKEVDASTNFITTMFLASDNYSDGFDNISELFDRINKVAN